jgi:hypothetical protein
MRLHSMSGLVFFALAANASIYAQQQATEILVPRVVRFHGTYHNANQQNQPGIVGATPPWTEIQNIQSGKDGNYTTLQGSTRTEGMLVDLFTTTGPRWLEVEIDQIRQPRILLSSVPYALKAADADTLGGLPASAYLRASNPAIPRLTSTRHSQLDYRYSCQPVAPRQQWFVRL